MTIDWSKAPEGATHYCEDAIDGTYWRDLSGQNAKYWFKGGWHDHGITVAHCLASNVRYTERPAWNGEGLPPVGTACEFAGFNPEEATFDDPVVGDKVTVIAHYLSGCVQVAAFTYNCTTNFGSLNVAQGAHGCFRPIRTAEQIAEEDRDRGIAELRQLLISGAKGSIESVIYDAGYRKQVSQ